MLTIEKWFGSINGNRGREYPIHRNLSRSRFAELPLLAVYGYLQMISILMCKYTQNTKYVEGGG